MESDLLLLFAGIFLCVKGLFPYHDCIQRCNLKTSLKISTQLKKTRHKRNQRRLKIFRIEKIYVTNCKLFVTKCFLGDQSFPKK
ncbi:hypothetical protein BpHYR1_000977 [Brachionus plicatilis]|uniref:Secreted protein n=1 Tax=Brachionus plicatilis TaxID=10195 RepID=A0A3M7T3M6_BRAPC|nr:hypothetical protein BpHYR1_000977 [Brachionus plicatilis]